MTGSYSLCLFASNIQGTASNLASMRLYSCKLYDSGILIRDFIPAKTQTGDIGLYDKLNDRFYFNKGTGIFIAGPEITANNI